MALAICIPMGIAGFFRVIAFQNTVRAALAITTSLVAIVFSSVIIGAGLPMVLHHLQVDPAHAGATIQVARPTHCSTTSHHSEAVAHECVDVTLWAPQVIMDLSGVLITCVVCSLMLAPDEATFVAASRNHIHG